jgi:hypothetical protein
MKATLAILALAATSAAGLAQTVPPAADPQEPPVATRDAANAPVEPAELDASQATARIEEQGYSNVVDLEQGEDGLWHARADKAGTTVDIVLDAAGNVTEAAH